MKIIANLPINPLSLGQVSVNILKELFRRDCDVSIFPIGNVDISVYNRLSNEFKTWLQNSINNRLKTLDKSSPCLKVWHINGSEAKIGSKQVLYSFYECDQPTQEELNIVSVNDSVLFSSTYAEKSFKIFGSQNVESAPLGFDTDFFEIEKRLISDKVIHWILVGKWEKRKNTALIINTWKRKYGNNPKHQLTLCVTNPFLNQDIHNQFFHQALDGGKPFNINILPHQDSNEKMNQLYNSADIDLSGFSNSEGWGLPAFMTTALGKWSIVSNCAAHKDWATKENCILVEPIGKQPIYDGIFFHQGQPFNQGNSFSLSVESLIAAMELAEKKARTKNTEGLKLQQQFTYEKTVNRLLEELK